MNWKVKTCDEYVILLPPSLLALQCIVFYLLVLNSKFIEGVMHGIRHILPQDTILSKYI